MSRDELKEKAVTVDVWISVLDDKRMIHLKAQSKNRHP